MKVEITKKLISEDGKRFSTGSDIAFKCKKDTKRYIGEIVDFTEDNLILKRVECRGIEDNEYKNTHVEGSLVIKLIDIEECNYVYCD